MEEKRIRRKKAIGLVVLIILVGIGALKIGKALPTIGALDTPANTNISMYYISHAAEDTHASNIVTAVLATTEALTHSLKRACCFFQA